MIVRTKGAAFSWIIGLAFFVSACGSSGPDDRICSTPQAEIAQGDWGECLHKWGYRLARSPDPAKVVADATVTACADAIAWQVSHGDVEDATKGGLSEGEARRSLNQQIMESAPSIALFRVVQARAGKCDFPPPK